MPKFPLRLISRRGKVKKTAFHLKKTMPCTPEMEFTSKAKKIAEESFAEEMAKKEKQRSEQRELAVEIARMDTLIKARMRSVGKLFFSKFFIKNYTVSFSHNDLSWYMHGHVIQTDIYTSIAIRLRDDRFLYSLDYLNDDIDQFKEFQSSGSSKDCSAGEVDNIFMMIIDRIARAKAIES